VLRRLRALAVVTQKFVDFLKRVVPYLIELVLVKEVGVLYGDSLQCLHPVGDQLALSRVSEIESQPLT
jgi:hypothetical protein